MASSSNSTSRSSCRQRVALIRQQNHEEEYEGQTRYYHHRLLAPRWTYWTKGNPGMRFYGCPNYSQDGGCGYFTWYDEDFGDRENVVIKELLDDIDKFYDENQMLRRWKEFDRFCNELEKIHGEVQKLKSMQEENERAQWKEETKYKVAVGSLLLTWLWFFIVYMK